MYHLKSDFIFKEMEQNRNEKNTNIPSIFSSIITKWIPGVWFCKLYILAWVETLHSPTHKVCSAFNATGSAPFYFPAKKQTMADVLQSPLSTRLCTSNTRIKTKSKWNKLIRCKVLTRNLKSKILKWTLLRAHEFLR